MIEKLTRTYTYLLPVLDIFVPMKKEFVVNAYLGVRGYNNDFNGKIFIKVRYDENNIEYERMLIENELYVSGESLNGHYLIKYRFPEMYYKSVYLNFINGRFSLFPSEIKKKILSYHKLTSKSMIYKILYKDPGLKKKMAEDLNVPMNCIDELADMVLFNKEFLEL